MALLRGCLSRPLMGFGGAVSGVGSVEVGQRVSGPLFQGASQGNGLGEAVDALLAIAVISVCVRSSPFALSDLRWAATIFWSMPQVTSTRGVLIVYE